MKKFILLIAALLATGAAAPETDGEAVTRRDHELNALIVAHDAAAAKSYYAPAFVLTTSGGKQKSKDDMLAEIARPGLVLEINETSQVVVRVHADTAVLTGVLHQRGTLDGTAFDVHVRVTDTWVRAGGEWRILAGHASKF